MRDKRMDGRGTAPHELLLIRAGHHLWKLWKDSGRQDKALFAALETVWEAKEAVRVPLRAEWLEYYEKRHKRLSGTRFKNAT
jgi:hypothetical protein